jgi:hypothetical protein
VIQSRRHAAGRLLLSGILFLAMVLPSLSQEAPPSTTKAEGSTAASCPWLRLTPCAPPVPPPPPPPCGDACQKLSEQLERGCSSTEDAPYADTIFLRRGLDLALPEPARARLALAALAETPAGAEVALAPLLSDTDPVTRYAAAVHLALAASRTNALSGSAGERARQIFDSAGALPFPKSDALFFEALWQLESGDSEAALTAAIEAAAIEPRFFNAHALVLRILMRDGVAVPGYGADRATCRKEFSLLIGALSAIADLEPCPRIAAHLEQFLARQLRAPDRAPGFAAAQVYLAMLGHQPELAHRALDRVARQDQLSCRADILPELQSFLTVGTARQ